MKAVLVLAVLIVALADARSYNNRQDDRSVRSSYEKDYRLDRGPIHPHNEKTQRLSPRSLDDKKVSEKPKQKLDLDKIMEEFKKAIEAAKKAAKKIVEAIKEIKNQDKKAKKGKSNARVTKRESGRKTTGKTKSRY